MTDTPGKAVRRIAKTLGVYIPLALLLWAAAPSVQRIFLLPQIFRPVLAVFLVTGLVVAVAVAWRYPHLGEGDGPDGP